MHVRRPHRDLWDPYDPQKRSSSSTTYRHAVFIFLDDGKQC